ncbi:hypothetical protein B0H11DRAFT_2103448, partial [Mycena galericulata]
NVLYFYPMFSKLLSTAILAILVLGQGVLSMPQSGLGAACGPSEGPAPYRCCEARRRDGIFKRGTCMLEGCP